MTTLTAGGEAGAEGSANEPAAATAGRSGRRTARLRPARPRRLGRLAGGLPGRPDLAGRHPHQRVEHPDVAEVVGLVGEARSEEHTSELQSHHDLVCRLLLEKKKK